MLRLATSLATPARFSRRAGLFRASSSSSGCRGGTPRAPPLPPGTLAASRVVGWSSPGSRASPARRAASSRGARASARPVDPGPPPHVALVTFSRAPGGRHELGLVENGEWVWTLRRPSRRRGPGADDDDAVDSGGPPFARAGGMIELIAAWHAAGGALGRTAAEILETERRGDPVPLASVHVLAPVPDPTSVVCVGKNYLEHVGEVDSSLPGISAAEAPADPIIFTKAPTSVVGPGASIVIPRKRKTTRRRSEGEEAVPDPDPADPFVSDQIDYEGELGVVVGETCSRVRAEDWAEVVFGFTIINDVTARDVQKRHQQWYLGKSFDTFCPMGPWIVPKRALFERHPPVEGSGGRTLRLDVGTAVNGEPRQGSNASKMIFDVGALIETVTAAMTLRPGDVIATGTPAGVGAGMDPKGFLRPGDACEVKVEGVGVLRNPVVAEE